VDSVSLHHKKVKKKKSGRKIMNYDGGNMKCPIKLKKNGMNRKSCLAQLGSLCLPVDDEKQNNQDNDGETKAILRFIGEGLHGLILLLEVLSANITPALMACFSLANFNEII
jgi:hypothetical protein